MASREERRAELEAQMAALDAEEDDLDIDSVDIQDGDKSVRFTGKGAVGQAKRWLKHNFSDLFDPDQDEAPAEGGADDKPAEPVNKRAFGRTIGRAS
jgi:hypothetical protein